MNTSVKSKISIIFLFMFAVLAGILSAYPRSVVACYWGKADGDYSSSVMRLTLFKIKGAEWYLDHILFPKEQSSQNIIISEGNYLGIWVFEQSFCECCEMASAVREAYNHMSENNDTIYTPIHVWDGGTFRNGNFYPDTTNILIKINELNELNRPISKPYYFSVSYGIYDNFNDITGKSTAPVARFWKYKIFCSPFIITSSRNTAVYNDYLEHCRETGTNVIPANTTGIDRCQYTREEIGCYLGYALEADRQEAEEGVEVMYVQPFTFDGNHDCPTVELSIPLDSLSCDELESFVRIHCDTDQ